MISHLALWVGYGLDDWGVLVRFSEKEDTFFCNLRFVYGINPSSHEMIIRFFTSCKTARKWRGSPTFGAGVKDKWSYTSVHPDAWMLWCWIRKGDNFLLPCIHLALFCYHCNEHSVLLSPLLAIFRLLLRRPLANTE